MILFASGRTDIPAFYGDWFLRRYEEGYVDTRNPFYPKLVSRIYFKDVDLLFFCSKNPVPLLDKIQRFDRPMIFHVTITPYRKDVEPNVVDKKAVIEAVKRLSEMIGKENVVVRYDPILLSDVYDIDYHLRAFERLTQELKGYIETVIVSFLDECKSVKRNASLLRARIFTEEDYRRIGEGFSSLAAKAGMVVQTCYEERNLFEYGFYPGECLSAAKALSLTGKKYPAQTARKGGGCRCVRMCDIGDYNCCPHGCKYCYANFDESKVRENMMSHDPNSSLLLGHVQDDDIIKVRQK